MQRTNIFLHNENGITLLRINNVDIAEVCNYKIASSANGKTELTFTILSDAICTELEVDLAKNEK